MKILIISNSFSPENTPRAFRTTELAKELARKGHEVKVIFPNKGYDYSGLNNDKLTIEPISKINWQNIELKGNKVSLLFRKVLKMGLNVLFDYPVIEWYVKMPAILKNEQGYDLLISIAVPHSIHWGVSRCMQKNKNLAKAWIADCGDPYMGVVTRDIPRMKYFSVLEKKFCQCADYITIPEESGRAGYYKEFQNKIEIIPQGFNFEEIKLKKFVQKDKVRFCYAGHFIPRTRDPRPILDFLLSVKDIDFEFTIFTNQLPLIKGYVDKMGDKLQVRNYIPRLELMEYMSEMDFLLNIENGTDVQVPSKLIDYSLTKRPILSLNSQKLDTNKLLSFLNRQYDGQFLIEDIEKYNIKNVANRFLSLAKEV